jgi:hypothetical protein
MYKATRLLIEQRLKHSRYNVNHVSVTSVPIGEANQCHRNTFVFQKNDVLNTGCKRSMPLSGWLIGKYDIDKDETEIIQHWWNVDSVSEQHFDTTPFDGRTPQSDYEYVADVEISLWGNANFNEIKSNVCNSLCLRSGKWYLVKEGKDGKLIYRETDSLKVENLFLELGN